MNEALLVQSVKQHELADQALESERLAQANAASLEHLVDQAPYGVYLVDWQFRIARVSQGALRVFDNVRPLIGRDFAEAIHIIWPADLADKVESIFRHTLATGEPFLAPSLTAERYDVGEIESYEWQTHRLTLPDGHPGVVCYFFDTTLIRKAEAVLRESVSQFRQIADSMPPIVWTARPDGYVDYYNERWYEFTGFPRNEFGDSSWMPLLHPDDLQRTADAYYACIRDGAPYEVEFRLRDRSTGGYRWFMGRALPIRDERGAILRWFGSSTDIDASKRSEEIVRERLEDEVTRRTQDLLKTNEQLQGFTYSVAHDLRQHIRGISTNASIMLSDSSADLDADSRETLNRIVNNAKKLATFVDDLLVYARLGRQELTKVPIDITEMADTVVALAIERGVCKKHVTFRIARGLVGLGDQRLVQVILENLIDNACKYSSAQECPLVEVGAVGQAIYVRDNGVGFDMDYQSKLFQPFERLHTDSEYSGSGIGLANARRIVEKHGGKIWATGEPGKGATFYFTLA